MKYLKIKLEDNKSVLVDSSTAIENKDWYWDENKLKVKHYFESKESFPSLIHRFKIVATINYSISLDVPMVIIEDEVEKFLFKLCYYDLRNPDNCIDTSELTKEELAIPQVHSEDFANVLCSCYNCFYGETEMAEYIINKASQQKSYSEEDLRKYHNIMCLHGNIAGEEFIQSLKQEYIELEIKWTLGNEEDENQNLIPVRCIKTNRVDGQLMAYIKH
jgi:hypothetical protein